MCVKVKRCLYRAVYVKLDAAGRARVLFATDQGHVSPKSRKLFGSEKQFEKLRSTYLEKLICQYVFVVRENKTITFRDLKSRRFVSP